MENEIFYFAKIAENEYPVPFKLIQLSDNQAVFENDNHDFPQRIIYSLKSPQLLMAEVVGEEDGKFKRIEFKFYKK